MKKAFWYAVFTVCFFVRIGSVGAEQSAASSDDRKTAQAAEVKQSTGESAPSLGEVKLDPNSPDFIKQINTLVSGLTALQTRVKTLESAVSSEGNGEKSGKSEEKTAESKNEKDSSDDKFTVFGRLAKFLKEAAPQQKKKIINMLRADEILQDVLPPQTLSSVLDPKYKYSAKNKFFEDDGIFSELNVSLSEYAGRAVAKLVPYLKGAVLGREGAAEKRFFAETEETAKKLQALREEELEIARSNHISENNAISKIVEWESNYLMAPVLQEIFDQGEKTIKNRMNTEVSNFLPFSIGENLRCSNKILANYLKSKEAVDKARDLYDSGKADFAEYEKVLGKLPGEEDLERFIEQAGQLLDILWAKKPISEEEWSEIIHNKAGVPMGVRFEAEKDEKGNVKKDENGKEIRKKVKVVNVYKPTQHKSITSMLKHLKFAGEVNASAMNLETDIGVSFMKNLEQYIYDGNNFSAAKIERGEITKKYDEFKNKIQELKNRGSVIKTLLKSKIDIIDEIAKIEKKLSPDEQRIFKQISDGFTADKVNETAEKEDAYKHTVELRDALLEIAKDTASKKGYVTGEKYWKYFPKAVAADAFVNNEKLVKPASQPAKSSKQSEFDIKEELRQRVMKLFNDKSIPENARKEFAKTAKLADGKVSVYGTDSKTAAEWTKEINKLDIKRLLYSSLLELAEKSEKLSSVKKKLEDVFKSGCDTEALSKKLQDLKNTIDKAFDEYKNNFQDVIFTKALEQLQIKDNPLQTLHIELIGYLDGEARDAAELDRAIEDLRREIKERRESFVYAELLKNAYIARIKQLLEYAARLKNYKGKTVEIPNKTAADQMLRVLHYMQENQKRPEKVKPLSDKFNFGEFFVREFISSSEKSKNRYEELKDVIRTILSRNEKIKMPEDLTDVLKKIGETVNDEKIENAKGVLDSASLDNLIKLCDLLESNCRSAYDGFTGFFVMQLKSSLGALPKDSTFAKDNSVAIERMNEKNIWFDPVKTAEFSADEKAAAKEYSDITTFSTKGEELCVTCEKIKEVVGNITGNKIPAAFADDDESITYDCAATYLQKPMPGVLVSLVDIASGNKITTAGNWISLYNERGPLEEALKNAEKNIPAVKINAEKLESDRVEIKNAIDNLESSLVMPAASGTEKVLEPGAVPPPPPPPPPPSPPPSPKQASAPSS